MSSNQERFDILYGNKSSATCNGSELLGASYVCPTPTIGGKGPSPFPKQNTKCTPYTPNMAKLPHCVCCEKQLKKIGGKKQKGGAANISPVNLVFTANGILRKKCKKDFPNNCNGKCGEPIHLVARTLVSKNLYPPDMNDNIERGNSKSTNYSGDPSNLDYPRDTCGCKSSSDCGYFNGAGTPRDGYFTDTTGSAGNRPLYGRHDNLHINSPSSWNDNLTDRKFNCQQPFWCEKCM